MTTIRRKKTTPLEDFAEISQPSPLLKAAPHTIETRKPEKDFLEDAVDQGDDLHLSKLDLFALIASSAVAKKMDDASQIAHTSYQIAFKMAELSEVYADWKPKSEKK